MSLSPEPRHDATEEELADACVGWMAKRNLIRLIERVVRRVLAETKPGA